MDFKIHRWKQFLFHQQFEHRENFMRNQESNMQTMMRAEDYLMTDTEIANLAKVPVGTVRYWRMTGIMPFVKVGRHPRIWLSTFQKVFEKPDTHGSGQI